MQLHKEPLSMPTTEDARATSRGMFEDVYPYRRKKRFRFQRGDDLASGAKRDAMAPFSHSYARWRRSPVDSL